MEAVLQGNAAVKNYSSKHFRPEIRKGLSRAVLKNIVAIEMIIAAVLCCILFLTCWNRAMNAREQAVITSFTDFDTQNFAAMAGHSINAAEEEVNSGSIFPYWPGN